MTAPLYGVYGTGGCGRGIMPLARRQLSSAPELVHRLVFIDDARRESTINGHAVVRYSEFISMPASERFVALALADTALRERLAERLTADNLQPWSVRAENVVMMDDVIVGEGALLSPFVTLTSNIRIGRYFHANLYSYVEHDCRIGDFVTFAPGAKCNGNVLIEDYAYIGAGAVIRQGKPGQPLAIGKGAVIGMGAIVTRTVPAGTIVVGNPARPLHRKSSA